jgi:hypothetical protein
MCCALGKSTAVILAAWTLLTLLTFTAVNPTRAAEPPALNPFAPVRRDRDDAQPGYIEISDGKIYPGSIYMTRDKRLKIYDEKTKRQREIPLRVAKQIDCWVLEEWMEKEWRFKELALNEKYYTGRKYPSREYRHTITLQDGRMIAGPLAEIIYVRPFAESPQPGQALEANLKPQRFLLHKRDKGEVDTEMKALKYVKLIKLGEEALAEGRKKAAARQSSSAKPKKQVGDN